MKAAENCKNKWKNKKTLDKMAKRWYKLNQPPGRLRGIDGTQTFSFLPPGDLHIYGKKRRRPVLPFDLSIGLAKEGDGLAEGPGLSAGAEHGFGDAAADAGHVLRGYDWSGAGTEAPSGGVSDLYAGVHGGDADDSSEPVRALYADPRMGGAGGTGGHPDGREPPIRGSA